ncbi:T9SS type A sorting domain-containing protein [bacterium]|nr:T9SS type A sorting domain-containing protein [bacterium]
MKYLSSILLAVFVLAFAASAQVYPPYGLTADLGQNGEVTLEWNAPSAGLAETFDADPGTSWNWLVNNLSFSDGYAKLDGTGTTSWQTGAYEAMEFDDFTLSGTFEIQDTSTGSRGFMWCTNGPRDADFNGYGMYVSGTSYSVWKYTAGSASAIISWATGTGINTGQGAVNSMEIQASGGTFDLYINGTYHNSFTDATYPQGYVGVIEAYNVTWYDEIFCTMGAVDAVPAPAAQGTPVEGYFDDAHNPIDAPMPMAEGVRVFDRFGEPQVDEFLNYKVYRNGSLVGEPTTEMFVDNLPGEGTFEYTVTAYYDEGESTPAGPVEVTWTYVMLTLDPSVTTVPEGGGDVVYDASLVSTIPAQMAGLRYQTFVTLPNSNVVGPVDNIPFTLVPYMNFTAYDFTLTVPSYAPEGAYNLEGIAGVPNNPNMQVTDNFDFAKVGAGLFEDFSGNAPGFEFYVGDGSYVIEDGYCKFDQVAAAEWGSGSYTGMDFDNFSLSTTFEYAVTQGYSCGLLFRGNGPQDADYEGYAVYISNTSYSCWYYVAGAPQNIIGWTTGVGINTGVGAVNTLQIDASGTTFDITINGTYQGSFSDATYATGQVGMATAYTNETWFDEIGATFNAPNAIGPAHLGELEPMYRDHMGQPTAPYDRGVAYDRSGEFVESTFEFVREDWAGDNSFGIASNGSSVNVPTEFALENAYPNPFNPSTSFAVTLPEAADLKVNVYNVTGQLVATVASGDYSAGRHTMTFDASSLASGLYFIRATVPGQMDQTQKVMLVR